MLIVAIICAALGVILLALGVAWLLGWTPARDGAPPPSAVEARERAGDLAAEFWDWLRLGR